MNIHQKTFANGLRLVVVPQSQAATATVLILVGTGSDYEHDQQHGIAHFLEHLCFKGTPTRPNSRIISESFDRIGAVSNAFTDHECTGYYAKGGPEHVPFFIDILSDIYAHAIVDPVEMEKEKGVIVEEINMYEDMPQYKVSEQLYAAMYGNQSAGHSVAGTKESVRGFQPADIISFRNAYYVPNNTVVVVSGAVDVATVEALVDQAFTHDTQQVPTKPITTLATDTFTTTLTYKKTDQAHLIVAFPSLPFGHKDLPALSLLGTMLGGGMSSRLFMTIREELGVAYYVRCDHEVYTDHGMFAVAAGVATDRIQEVIDAIVTLLSVLKKDGVLAEELEKAKQYTVGMMRLGLESSDDIAHYVGNQLLLRGEIKTPEQRIAQMQQVTIEDIARVAQGILVGTTAHISIVGPYESMPVNTTALASL